MREDSVVELRQPETFSEDQLTEVLRLGARRLLASGGEQAEEWRGYPRSSEKVRRPL